MALTRGAARQWQRSGRAPLQKGCTARHVGRRVNGSAVESAVEGLRPAAGGAARWGVRRGEEAGGKGSVRAGRAQAGGARPTCHVRPQCSSTASLSAFMSLMRPMMRTVWPSGNLLVVGRACVQVRVCAGMCRSCWAPMRPVHPCSRRNAPLATPTPHPSAPFSSPLRSHPHTWTCAPTRPRAPGSAGPAARPPCACARG